MGKVMVRETINKMKNEKAAGPSELVLEVIKPRGKAEIDVIVDLNNQILGVILVE